MTKDFQENINAYKAKLKGERESLEKVILKSDKVINYLYNAAIELAKSVGKILHNLVLSIDYDMKEILRKIAVEDMTKVHEWIQWFERNDYLKKNKIYRGMSDKLNFYRKLEIPVLQDAYGRILKRLREGERLAERGEFSMLNLSQANFVNKSVVSTNKSVISNKNESMHADGNMINILDELNNDNGLVNPRKETVAEAIARLHEKINADSLVQLTPPVLAESIKKIQGVAGRLNRQVATGVRFDGWNGEGERRGRWRSASLGGPAKHEHNNQESRVLRRKFGGNQQQTARNRLQIRALKPCSFESEGSRGRHQGKVG